MLFRTARLIGAVCSLGRLNHSCYCRFIRLSDFFHAFHLEIRKISEVGQQLLLGFIDFRKQLGYVHNHLRPHVQKISVWNLRNARREHRNILPVREVVDYRNSQFVGKNVEISDKSLVHRKHVRRKRHRVNDAKLMNIIGLNLTQEFAQSHQLNRCLVELTVKYLCQATSSGKPLRLLPQHLSGLLSKRFPGGLSAIATVHNDRDPCSRDRQRGCDNAPVQNARRRKRGTRCKSFSPAHLGPSMEFPDQFSHGACNG